MRISSWLKSSNPYKLLTYNFRGFPVGIVVGFILAVSVSAYAAPKLFSTKAAYVKPASKQTDLTTGNKKPISKSSPTSQTSQTSNQPVVASTSSGSSSPTSSKSTSTASSTPSNTPVVKPQATITGIEVLSPTQGANETVYFPYCDFGSIDSGIPETCYHYQPIPFNLVETLSDGTTSPLGWSNATVSALNPSGGYPPYPTLINIDQSNNTLIEGTGMGYFLNTHTSNEIVTLDVNYGQWSYTKYIHIYVNSLWGNP